MYPQIPNAYRVFVSLLLGLAIGGALSANALTSPTARCF